MLIENEAGEVLNMEAANHIRRHISDLLHDDGALCAQGPK
jgi:hypothetical protein